MANGVLEIQCPCCHSTLKVDADTGAVLAHKQPEKPPSIEDLAVAAANLKGEAAKREEVFQKSFTAEKNRESIMSKRFDELFKQAQADPDKRPPQRDIDLD
jgi:hypothetical protein